MKWLRLTTKECDILNYMIGKWRVCTKINDADETFKTYRENEFTSRELGELEKKIDTAYWDKDSND